MQYGQADSALIIFLRLPISGKVKTRIAATEGDDHALAIYLQLMDITLELAANSEKPVYLFFEGGLPELSARQPGYIYLPQSSGDLGKKMADAFSLVLQNHAKAVLIGSDCPTLSKVILNKAFSQLDLDDIVLGPSRDGGYYLIGCKNPHPEIFEGITWSTPSVLESTIQRIRKEKLTFSLLEELVDIDTAADWHQYKANE